MAMKMSIFKRLCLIFIWFIYQLTASSSAKISIPMLVGSSGGVIRGTKRMHSNQTILDRIPNSLKNGLASGLAAAVCKGMFF